MAGFRRRVGWKIATASCAVGLVMAAGTVPILVLARDALDPTQFRLTAFGLALSVILAVGAAIVLSVRSFLSRPLKDLTRLMDEAEDGNFLVRAPDNAGGEVGELAASFNRFLRKITDLQVDVIDVTTRMEREATLKTELEEQAAVIESTNAELSDRVRDLTILASLNRSVSSSLLLTQVLEAIARELAEALNLSRVSFWLREGPDEDLALAAGYGAGYADDVEAKDSSARCASIDGSTVGASVLTGAPVVVVGAEGAGERRGAIVCVPIPVGGDRVGALEVTRAEVDAPPETEVRLLEQVAHVTGLAVRNGRLTRRMMELAVTDELTGLSNRRHLMERLGEEMHRAKRFDHSMSLLILDIDHFKEFNDRYGHLAGDRVLAGVASLMAQAVRSVDTAGRYGGEEFVLVLPRTRLEGAVELAEKLRRQVSKWRPDVDGVPPDASITISVGVSEYPQHAEDAESLLRSADQALFRAKEQGRDRVLAA